ncbi:MAG TPA: polyphenol oxidase family protein, partial [Rhizomicrobium sp.]
MTQLSRLESESLNSPGIAHGFFGREGGVSTGIYNSLNCGPGSKDAPEAVAENRRRVISVLAPGSQLISMSQIHSAIVHTLPAPPREGAARLEGDGLVTATPGLALGILTADCAPVLLADPQAKVIGAAHAGWKGALGEAGRGVLEATLDAMESL